MTFRLLTSASLPLLATALLFGAAAAVATPLPGLGKASVSISSGEVTGDEPVIVTPDGDDQWK
ncbi:hypothetical protein AB0M28_38545 [Streptomyces sp. NPDC051940]|uniref:hypothetical protein n=1 Tax=Streptomyces sp. NPDC051940 TaxID=3155675 RepID=UPI00342D4B95